MTIRLNSGAIEFSFGLASYLRSDVTIKHFIPFQDHIAPISVSRRRNGTLNRTETFTFHYVAASRNKPGSEVCIEHENCVFMKGWNWIPGYIFGFTRSVLAWRIELLRNFILVSLRDTNLLLVQFEDRTVAMTAKWMSCRITGRPHEMPRIVSECYILEQINSSNLQSWYSRRRFSGLNPEFS